MTDDKATPADNLVKAERRLRADLDRGDWAYGVNWARDMRVVLDAATALAAERDRADSRVSRVQYEEACRLLRERTGQLSDAQDRADRAEADAKRVQLVRGALVSYEDGRIEPIAYLLREVDRIVNNTKDDELGEATA